MRNPHPAILHIVHLLGLDTSHGERGGSPVDALHRLRLGSRLLELLVVRRSSVHLRRVLRLMQVEVRRLLMMRVLVDGGVVRNGRLLSRQSLVRWGGEGEFAVRGDLRSRSWAAASAAATVLALRRRGIGHAGDRLAEEVGVDRLAADLMLLAVGVQVVLALEPTTAEIAFELVFGRVGATVASEGGGIVEGLAAEGSLADEGAFIVVSTHVSLIAMARQENLSTHFAREGSSNFLAACSIAMHASLVSPQIGSTRVGNAAILAHVVDTLGRRAGGRRALRRRGGRGVDEDLLVVLWSLRVIRRERGVGAARSRRNCAVGHVVVFVLFRVG